MSGEDYFKLATDEIDNLINANTIMGDAIDAGDKVIIPIASFGFGFGGGMAKGEEKFEGAGAGAGGGVSPIAIVVLHKEMTGIESVQVISLKKHTALSEAIATISEKTLPQVTETIKTLIRIYKPEELVETEVQEKIPAKTKTA